MYKIDLINNFVSNVTTYQNILENQDYSCPVSWYRIKTIDMHTQGEPLRVIVSGLPELTGNSVLEYRQNMKDHHDDIRTALMFEPRGHADMYGCVLLPPNNNEADFGVIFLHNEGYSTMCGHAIIALTKLAVEMNWVTKTSPETAIKIDAPCGRIDSFAIIEDGEVVDVYFHCVPSFVVALKQSIFVEDIGLVNYDLAYGGAFYAYVDADELDISLTADNVQEHIQKGMAIKRAVMESSKDIIHPFEEELSFLYGTIFVSQLSKKGIDSRHVCVFAEGEVDRSPTGSGVSGRMAIHHAKGEMLLNQPPMIIESIIGTTFKASIVAEVDFGTHKAVIPRVQGNAHIIGQNEWLIDPNDPLKSGFLLR